MLTNENNSSSSAFVDNVAAQPVKQLRSGSTTNVHHVHHVDQSLHDDGVAPDVEQRPASGTSQDGLDYKAMVHHLLAKSVELDAKLAQLHTQSPLEMPNGGYEHPFALPTSVVDEPQVVARKPALPILNRTVWIEFKNLYTQEDLYAIDVLMVGAIVSQTNMTDKCPGTSQVLLATPCGGARDERSYRNSQEL